MIAAEERSFLKWFNIDKLVKSQETPFFVVPAKAGIQGTQPLVDSRFRGSDGLGDFLHGRQP